MRPTLDDVFLALTGRSLRDEGSRTHPTTPTTDRGGRSMSTVTVDAPTSDARPPSAGPGSRDIWLVMTRELRPVVREPVLASCSA